MSHKYQIEAGVPTPPKRCQSTKYPFSEMSAGDSFFVADGDNKVVSASCAAGRRLGRKFSTRKVEGGVRVWRVK